MRGRRGGGKEREERRGRERGIEERRTKERERDRGTVRKPVKPRQQGLACEKVWGSGGNVYGEGAPCSVTQ